MGADTEIGAGHNELHGTLPSGTRLRNYELVSVLGHGAFGITYRARDTALGREVAIKEYLPTSLALREDGTMVIPRSTQFAEDFVWGRERFLEEARTLVTLEGVPAVVRVYDYLEANGTAYMVMALARGETLEQRLKRGGPLPPPVVERLLHRLLDGLEQVHTTGFLHRDIKPANIILDAKDNPTLIDFGASRASMADRTSAMTAVFTPRYAAVEQLTSDVQGPWTDIYGLSVTLYYAVVGRVPPTAMERLLKDGYEPLTKLQPAGFPQEILKGIDAGLAVRAADRPQSIAAWRASFALAEERLDDATVVGPRVRPGQAPKPATVARPSAPPARVAPPPPPVAVEPVSAAPVSSSSPLSAVTGRKRLALYAGAAAAVVALTAAGYLIFAPQLAQQSEIAAQRQSEDDARAKAAADAEAKRQAEEAQAEREKAEAEARQKAAADAKRQAEEAQAKALAERQKAEAEAKQKADAEAKRQADEALAKAQAEREKAEAEARQKAEAEAKQKADAEAERQAEEAQAKALAERQKAEAEAKQKADAEAQTNAAEAGENALRLTSIDRQRLQVALTSLGFDTRGNDGVFGPRSREMIAAWQKARNQPDTGFLSGPQQEALLRESATETARKLADEQAAAAKRAKAGQAAEAKPALSRVDPRCKSILQAAQLTGALADEDRAYLRDRCR